jgi:pimeloyl-ACP methyl ester carboxylesterase
MAKPGRSSLVLIPGLGSDAALYEPQRRALGDRLVVPPWLPPLNARETLESYARRMAEVIQGDPRVVKPYFVGGISFGGMLAAEIAECCAADVAGLILIGGCTDQSEIPGIFRLLALAGQHVPTGLLMPLARRLAPAVITWWQGLSPEDADLFASVYGRGNIGLLKWGADAMRRWESAIVVRDPVYRAHGRRDDVIPIPEHRMRPGRDLVVPDGRHLISLTHAAAVNRWLLGVMDGGARKDEG